MDGNAAGPVPRVKCIGCENFDNVSGHPLNLGECIHVAILPDGNLWRTCPHFVPVVAPDAVVRIAAAVRHSRLCAVS